MSIRFTVECDDADDIVRILDAFGVRAANAAPPANATRVEEAAEEDENPLGVSKHSLLYGRRLPTARELLAARARYPELWDRLSTCRNTQTLSARVRYLLHDPVIDQEMLRVLYAGARALVMSKGGTPRVAEHTGTGDD